MKRKSYFKDTEEESKEFETTEDLEALTTDKEKIDQLSGYEKRESYRRPTSLVIVEKAF